jgi:hypothetical protein
MLHLQKRMQGWPTQRGFRCVGIFKNRLLLVWGLNTFLIPTEANIELEWATRVPNSLHLCRDAACRG